MLDKENPLQGFQSQKMKEIRAAMLAGRYLAANVVITASKTVFSLRANIITSSFFLLKLSTIIISCLSSLRAFYRLIFVEKIPATSNVTFVRLLTALQLLQRNSKAEKTSILRKN